MSLIVYTLLRALLVLAAAGLLYLAGLRGLLLVLVAVLVGALLSFVLLKGPRDRAAQTLEGFAVREPGASASDADARAEDADLEAGSAEPEQHTEDDAER